MVEDTAVDRGPWGDSPDGTPGIDAMARAILEANQQQFLRAGRSQRFAFATMKWLFIVVFVLALGAMIAAVRIATHVPPQGYNWAQAGVVTAIGATSLLLLMVLLYVRPLAALERNSVVQAFLTVVVNSYWSRLMYAKGTDDIAVHLEDATAYTVDHLGALLDRQILGRSKYMNLVRRAQDEADQDPGAYATPL
jgi:uncharacterized membrane protein YhaH (DUF805 family)